jgi:transcriptional regulator with XRE-family HTH domain
MNHGAWTEEDWIEQRNALGAYIREQRKLANLSLRQLADMARISNPYLSQLERGMHEPSVRVLRSIAKGLKLSAESMLEQAGLLDDEDEVDGDASGSAPSTEAAIRADPRLTEEQKHALLAVYRSYASANASEADDDWV